VNKRKERRGDRPTREGITGERKQKKIITKKVNKDFDE